MSLSLPVPVISIPYRSYSNNEDSTIGLLLRFISIPYRSYSNKSRIWKALDSLLFQSLIGLILTAKDGSDDIITGEFQSLIGLILTEARIRSPQVV